MDALNVIWRAVERLRNTNPGAFKHTLRNGKVFNNGSEGIDCDAEPVAVFRHGYEMMKAMREVTSSTFVRDVLSLDSSLSVDFVAITDHRPCKL